MVYLVTATLIFIALGMGMNLVLADFSKLLSAPKAVFVGFIGQIILLPIIAIALAYIFGNPVIAVGLIMMGVCPGGSSSNFFSYLARGDVALSIALTACSGLLSVIYVPLIFNISADWVLQLSSQVSLPVWKTVSKIVFCLILPVIAGMWIRNRFPMLATNWAGRISSVAFIALVVQTPLLIWRYLEGLSGFLFGAFIAASLLLTVMIPAAYFLAKITGLVEAQGRSITIEVAVQNVALAIVLILSFFDNPTYLAVPILYLLAMYIFIPMLIVLFRWRDRTP